LRNSKLFSCFKMFERDACWASFFDFSWIRSVKRSLSLLGSLWETIQSKASELKEASTKFSSNLYGSENACPLPALKPWLTIIPHIDASLWILYLSTSEALQMILVLSKGVLAIEISTFPLFWPSSMIQIESTKFLFEMLIMPHTRAYEDIKKGIVVPSTGVRKAEYL